MGCLACARVEVAANLQWRIASVKDARQQLRVIGASNARLIGQRCPTRQLQTTNAMAANAMAGHTKSILAAPMMPFVVGVMM